MPFLPLSVSCVPLVLDMHIWDQNTYLHRRRTQGRKCVQIPFGSNWNIQTYIKLTLLPSWHNLRYNVLREVVRVCVGLQLIPTSPAVTLHTIQWEIYFIGPLHLAVKKDNVCILLSRLACTSNRHLLTVLQAVKWTLLHRVETIPNINYLQPPQQHWEWLHHLKWPQQNPTLIVQHIKCHLQMSAAYLELWTSQIYLLKHWGKLEAVSI